MPLFAPGWLCCSCAWTPWPSTQCQQTNNQFWAIDVKYCQMATVYVMYLKATDQSTRSYRFLSYMMACVRSTLPFSFSTRFLSNKHCFKLHRKWKNKFHTGSESAFKSNKYIHSTVACVVCVSGGKPWTNVDCKEFAERKKIEMAHDDTVSISDRWCIQIQGRSEVGIGENLSRFRKYFAPFFKFTAFWPWCGGFKKLLTIHHHIVF